MIGKPKWIPKSESECIRNWTENLHKEAKRLLVKDGTHASLLFLFNKESGLISVNPVPPNVDLVSFTQFVPGSTGGHLLAADTEPFEAFRLDWNGVNGYADLATGTNVQAFQVNGWSVVEASVPLADFHGLDTPNSGVTTRDTAGLALPLTQTATCTYFSE